MNVKFRYERVFGYSKVNGMLEHGVSGCSGPPDLLELVDLGNIVGGPFDGGTVEARVCTPIGNPNPNWMLQKANGLNLVFGGGSVGGSSSGSSSVPVANPFKATSSTFTFSLLGVSATASAAQLHRFKSPMISASTDSGDKQLIIR